MFEIGDMVRVIDETHGWAEVNHGDVGKVIHVDGSDDDILYTVSFDNHNSWLGRSECFVPYDGVYNDAKGTDPKVIKLLSQIKKISGDVHTLAYQGNGFAGYVPIRKGCEFRPASCYSPICKDVCEMLVKPIDYSSPLSKSDWEYLIKFIKRINPRLRNIDKYGYSNKVSAMYFNTGKGYLNYLAFCIYRDAVNNKNLVKVLKYFSDMGYDPVEVYVIAIMCKELWVTSYSKFLLSGQSFYKSGLIKRLKNVCRYRFHGAYSMEHYVFQRKTYQKAKKTGTFMFTNLYLGDKTWSEMLSRENIDEILNYMEVGDEI